METKFGVVLLVDAATEAFIRHFALVADHKGSNLLLSGSERRCPLPHLSLYHFRAERRRIERRESIYPLSQTLQACALGRPISGCANLMIAKRDKWLFLETPRTADLAALQDKVLDGFSSLNEGDYTYDYVKERFEPHFTVARWAPEDIPFAYRSGIGWRQDWTATQIALTQLGVMGEIKRVIVAVPTHTTPKYAW